MNENPLMEVRRLLQGILGGAFPASATPQVMATLCEVVRQSEDWLRELILAALGELGSDASRALPLLVMSLTDPSEVVVRRAVRVIGDLEGEAVEALPALIRILETDSWSVVVGEALAALARFGEAAIPAVPAICRWVARPEPRIRAIATSTLRRLGPCAADAVRACLSEAPAEAQERLRSLVDSWEGIDSLDKEAAHQETSPAALSTMVLTPLTATV